MSPKDTYRIANSVDPDQTAPLGAVWSGSSLFAQAYLSKNLGSIRYDHYRNMSKSSLNPNVSWPIFILDKLQSLVQYHNFRIINETKWAPSSEFVSSSIPSWQDLTAHAQPFRDARDLAFCLKVPIDSLLVWASSGGSGETARMRRLAWTFAARIGDKYQIRLTRSK